MVCTFCHATLVLNNLNLESVGKMSEMPDDMSPLQLGSKGQFEGAAFEVVGRQKIQWDDGIWNEWYIYLETGQGAWLGDAQGFYMVSFQVPDYRSFPKLSELRPATILTINKQNFSVEDIKKVTCSASEGELPVRSPQGRISTSIDLSGPSHQFANFDFGPDENRFFLGKYVDFDGLRLTNLREIDGW
jgi:hypothetical protein